MLKCDQCPKEFTHRPSLIKHKKNVHTSFEGKTCEICCKLIGNNFKRHFTSCKKKNETQTFVSLFECKICSKKFPWKKTLLRHMELHNGLKSVDCLQCGKKFTTQNNLDAHRSRIHGNVKCGYCYKELNSSLERHINNVHKHQVGESYILLEEKINKKVDKNEASNKMHIINDHFNMYIERNGKAIDECIEAAHAAMNKRMSRTNYVVKDIHSEKHGENLLKCVLHLNSYNI